jgi:hypothetical protein
MRHNPGELEVYTRVNSSSIFPQPGICLEEKRKILWENVLHPISWFQSNSQGAVFLLIQGF